ncbi:probable chitinase 2 [Episyrphus balteatus]|uniref:probable chitinase 2 n=1 Tax=Episyrphus balteatus TaxID=286459 RepID=UPI0024868D08|nr:probable chitinase 2 [Episyrphus balteatus]
MGCSIYFVLILQIQTTFLLISTYQTANASTKCSDRKAIFCYWASWAAYRPGNGHHNIKDINPEHCSHVIFTFAGLDIKGEITSLNPDVDLKGGFEDFIALKNRDPCGCLKVILAIGGWGEGSEKYSLMAESSLSRERFADSVLRWLIFYGFDGIDIDWEYPTQRGGLKIDRQNFIELLKVLKKKLAPRNRILTAAVSGSLETTKAAYDIGLMCNELDFISIMGYDLHQTNVTSIHSALRADNPDNSATISSTIEFYKKNGCHSEKLLLGVPAYGRTYILKDTRINKLGATSTGKGKEGPFTREKGFLGYNEIREMQKKNTGWQKAYSEKNAALYAFNGKLWMSYDDERTVKEKAEYVLSEKLGGMMLWSIDTDDFRGICSNRSYPLLRAITKGLKWNSDGRN